MLVQIEMNENPNNIEEIYIPTESNRCHTWNSGLMKKSSVFERTKYVTLLNFNCVIFRQVRVPQLRSISPAFGWWTRCGLADMHEHIFFLFTIIILHLKLLSSTCYEYSQYSSIHICHLPLGAFSSRHSVYVDRWTKKSVISAVLPHVINLKQLFFIDLSK